MHVWQSKYKNVGMSLQQIICGVLKNVRMKSDRGHKIHESSIWISDSHMVWNNEFYFANSAKNWDFVISFFVNFFMNYVELPSCFTVMKPDQILYRNDFKAVSLKNALGQNGIFNAHVELQQLKLTANFLTTIKRYDCIVSSRHWNQPQTVTELPCLRTQTN